MDYLDIFLNPDHFSHVAFWQGWWRLVGCSLYSYTEPDNEPRVGSLMLSWAGQNRGLTPWSVRDFYITPSLEKIKASDRNPCLTPSVLAAGIGSFFFLVLLAFSSSIFSRSPRTWVQGSRDLSSKASRHMKSLGTSWTAVLESRWGL